MARVTRPAELVLVVDQVVPADPLVALELDRFERARDPTHQRTLADADFRHFFEPSELRCMHTDFVLETRDLERYLDLAACEGEERAPGRWLRAPRSRLPSAGTCYGADYGRRLTVQPTGGVSRTAGSCPASTASIASRR
jgi:hypothetical protein